jgi:hypothetical protein
MVGLMLTGCVQQGPAVNPVDIAAQLSTGAPLLRCRADCVADWRRAQPDAAQLDAAAQWSELAALVITINYQDDLTLYYLARATEGLGYPTAAASYYRQSTQISGTSLSCQYESGVCGGVVLPDAALVRIEALESEARRSRPRPPRYPATRAKPAPSGSKPVTPAEREPRESTAPAREPQQPGAAEPQSLQPAAPISQPHEPTSPAPEQSQSTTSKRPDTGPEPSPPVRPASPPPTRLDPVAKQYIEPPAAR